MKHKQLSIIIALLSSVQLVLAQGTAFTYQGRLNDGALPATGVYDLQFSLWSAPSGPSQIGGTVSVNDRPVTNGLFTVSLDFGAGAFDGSSRWLQVDVRPGASSGAFTTLPRTQMLPSPYAMYAPSAGTASLAYGVSPGAVTGAGLALGAVDSSSIADNAITAAKLASDGASLSRVTAGNLLVDANRRIVIDPGNFNTGSVGHDSVVFGAGGSGEGLASKRNAGGNVNGLDFYTSFLPRLSIANNGNVGISKTNPATALDVNGTVTAVAFVGDGTGLANVNASTLNGLGVTSFWRTSGNAGTTPGTHFLGTTDDQPLEFKVGGARVLRIEPAKSGSVYCPNIIGGSLSNVVSPGVVGAFIGGGGQPDSFNSVAENYGTIAGGAGNTVKSGANCGMIAGGYLNTISGVRGFIGAGESNANAGDFAAIMGGLSNAIGAGGTYAVISGGIGNTNNAQCATVPGGSNNLAAGMYSFAAGQSAKANNQGAFVWADSQAGDFGSTANNQFLIRAAGGVGIGTASPTAALEVNGTVKATSFSGPGAGLTGVIPADSSVTSAKIVDGSIALADLNTGSVDGRYVLKAGDTMTGPLNVNGNVGIGTASPTTALDVNGDIRFNDKELYLRGNNADRNHGLGWYGNTKLFGSLSLDGPALYGFSGGVLGTMNRGYSTNVVLYWNNSSNVGIGTTSPGQRLDVNGRIRMQNWTGDGTVAVYKSLNGDLGLQASDARLKTNVTPIQGATALVEGMRGVTFNWRNDAEGAPKTVGLIAQEVRAVLPELTYTCQGEDGQTYFGVHYEKVAAVLVNAVKEQQALIGSQQSEIADMKARLEKLEQVITAKTGGGQ